jgi:hypothetical protein
MFVSALASADERTELWLRDLQTQVRSPIPLHVCFPEANKRPEEILCEHLLSLC